MYFTKFYSYYVILEWIVFLLKSSWEDHNVLNIVYWILYIEYCICCRIKIFFSPTRAAKNRINFTSILPSKISKKRKKDSLPSTVIEVSYKGATKYSPPPYFSAKNPPLLPSLVSFKRKVDCQLVTMVFSALL